jgi:hypothetical protein
MRLEEVAHQPAQLVVVIDEQYGQLDGEWRWGRKWERRLWL